MTTKHLHKSTFPKEKKPLRSCRQGGPVGRKAGGPNAPCINLMRYFCATSPGHETFSVSLFNVVVVANVVVVVCMH